MHVLVHHIHQKNAKHKIIGDHANQIFTNVHVVMLDQKNVKQIHMNVHVMAINSEQIMNVHSNLYNFLI